MSVNIDSFGYAESVDVTGNKTLATTDQGTVQNVTAAATVTLPAAAAGLCYYMRIAKAGLTASLVPAGTDTMAGNGFTATAAKGAVFTNQPAGSYVAVIGGSGTWNIFKLNGTATRTP